jgi:hypothetical protein
MVDESKLPFSFVLTSPFGLTKKTPWAILRGRTALRGALTINDFGLWIVQWFLVGSPVCMTLLERWGNTQMDDNARWCVEDEGLAVRVMSGNGAQKRT